MMRMNGNFDRLIGIREGLERLTNEGMKGIEHRAAVAIDLQLEKQFVAGESAAGERWANKVDGSPSHLQKTTKMRRSKRVAGVGGIKVSLDKPAGFHQGGTKKMVARPIVPVGNELPPNWDKAIRGAAREVLAEVGGG